MENSKVVPGYDLHDNVSGETFGIIAFPKNGEEKYTLRRLKMNIWSEAYTMVLRKTCNSSKDIELFELVLKQANRDNLMIASISKLQILSGMSRGKISTFLRKLVKIGFLAKEDTSVYMINPYVYLGNKAFITSRTAKAILQVEWAKKYGYPPETNELEEAGSLILEPTTN